MFLVTAGLLAYDTPTYNLTPHRLFSSFLTWQLARDFLHRYFQMWK